MAEVLFISVKDIKQFSVIDGNLDEDKIKQWVVIAQDTHIQHYLGTDLFDRLKAGIVADDLTANEITLMNDHVKKMTIHWSLVELLRVLPITIANKGVYKHQSEDSEIVDAPEVNLLGEKHRDIAQNYTRRFIDFMKYNKSDYPQYDSNTEDDVKPKKESDFGGWYL